MARNQRDARRDLAELSKATAAILPIAKRNMTPENAQGLTGFLCDLMDMVADRAKVEFDHSSVEENASGVNVKQFLSATERLVKGLEASA